jgi:HlyD family secretion protein
VTVVGTLERDRLELVAEAPEPILEIPVREGDVVAAGQLLVRLDPARLGAELARLEGERERAAARLAELERGTRHERIEAARARLEGARSRLRIASRELERMQELLARGVAAQSDLDAAARVQETARAERDAAAADYEEQRDGPTAEELAQARAALAAAAAAEEAQRVRLARLEVRAPVAGLVDALPFEPGERPPTGAVVVVMLADQAPWARVFVPEPIRARVHVGSTARVRVDGVERSFRARVRRVAREAAFTPFYALTERDRSHLAFEAEVELTEPEARALPVGVPLEVEFELEDVAEPAPPATAPRAETAP